MSQGKSIYSMLCVLGMSLLTHGAAGTATTNAASTGGRQPLAPVSTNTSLRKAASSQDTKDASGTLRCRRSREPSRRLLSFQLNS